MTPRWILTSFFIFGLAWLTLGIMSLTDGDRGMGIFQLALGITWLVLAIVKSRRSDSPTERRAGERTGLS